MVHSVDCALGVDLSEAGSEQVFNLGYRVKSSDGGVYEYCAFDADIDQYAACKIDDDYTLAELTTTLSGAEPTKIGIPQYAADGSSTTQYGFVFVGPGPCTVLTAADAAADVKLYTTATAGQLDDDGTGTDLIQGLKCTAAASATTGTAAFAAAELKTNSQD